jgi:transcriptional regulator with XRE-family HTH domain
MGQNNMKFYRKKAGLTQQELAKLLNVSKSWVSLKETGKRKVTTEEAELIAGALKRPVNKIFFA